MESELISVVIPTRTSEYKIKGALDAMINQTYKNLEILVIDDHGANATKGIVEEYMQKDSRVKYHLNPKQDHRRKNWRGYDINAGYSARDYGFRIAKGAWITTQDADDSSLLNRIEVQHRFAKKYGATLVAVQWMMRTQEREGKVLDIEALLHEKGEEALIIGSQEIADLAARNKGLLMNLPFHRYIPFTIKWFPYTRKLFYRRTDPYPGADNCIMFRPEVLKVAGFRPRNERVWGVPSGRGSGRDFVFTVAEKFRNSYSIKAPFYLWSVNMDNPDYPAAQFEPYIHA